MAGFSRSNFLKTWFLIFQVFDYDFALRDDFIGEATISLSQLDIDLETDLVLTLVETGKFEYLGQGTMLYKSLPS